MKSHKRYLILAVILLTVGLGGCGALSADVTPPPGGGNAPVGAAPTVTAPPPATATESSPTPDAAPAEDSPTEESPPAEEIPGTVNVEVLSDSEGGLPDGIEVNLYGYDHMNLAYEDARALPADGVATFEEIPFLEGRLYFAEIIHEGATYRSSITEVSLDSPTLNLSIEILGTTTDTASLVIDRLHIFLDFSQPEVLGVGEIFVVSNMGNQTVVAEEEDGAVLYFSLPEGATNLQFQDGQLGDRYLQTEDGFADTAQIRPGSGTHQIIVTFDLPYPKKSLEITQRMNYPTGAAIVLVEEEKGTITSPQLEDGGIQQTETGPIHIYMGQQMGAGTDLTFTVTNPNAGTELSRNVLLGLGILGGAIIAIGAWLYLRSRGDKKPTPSETPTDRDEILDTIIALDDLYENGEIGADVYHQRRSELKEQLGKSVGDG